MEAESESPRVWTPGRVTIALLLGLHWLFVLIFALPQSLIPRESLLRIAAPLPAINTHRGEAGVSIERQSVAQWYLALTSTRQRWTMFTPRRPNIVRMALDIEVAPGVFERHLFREDTRHWALNGIRWRALESGMMDPERRESLLPAALPVLAENILGHPATGEIVALKIAYPVPLLDSDGTGNPFFTTADAWIKTAADLTQHVEIEMARVGASPSGNQ